jgi:hypothetical protein
MGAQGYHAALGVNASCSACVDVILMSCTIVQSDRCERSIYLTCVPRTIVAEADEGRVVEWCCLGSVWCTHEECAMIVGRVRPCSPERRDRRSVSACFHSNELMGAIIVTVVNPCM